MARDSGFDIPWSRPTSLLDLTECVGLYPIGINLTTGMSNPYRSSWMVSGTGTALALIARYGSDVRPWVRRACVPLDRSAFYPRFAAHTLLGLALAGSRDDEPARASAPERRAHVLTRRRPRVGNELTRRAIDTGMKTSDSFQPVHVAVIGAGYVGLVTGVSLARLGHHVRSWRSASGLADLARWPVADPRAWPARGAWRRSRTAGSTSRSIGRSMPRSCWSASGRRSGHNGRSDRLRGN